MLRISLGQGRQRQIPSGGENSRCYGRQKAAEEEEEEDECLGRPIAEPIAPRKAEEQAEPQMEVPDGGGNQRFSK